MKLYMKQKVFSFKEKFMIKDEMENDRYFVEGEFLSWGPRLHVLDGQGTELALIKGKAFSFLPKYEIYQNENCIAQIVKEFTFFKQKYTISPMNWHVEGDYLAHDYRIYAGEQLIITIQKAWFSWGDSYEINIAPGVDELLAVLVVLSIDCAMARQKNN